MFTPAIFTRNHNFWRDPFDEFNEMFPAFFDNGDLEKSFAGFKTDVMEKDGNYVLESELPGFAKEDIHVDLKDDILTISASHKEEKKEEDKKQRETQRMLQQKFPRSQCYTRRHQRSLQQRCSYRHITQKRNSSRERDEEDRDQISPSCDRNYIMQIKEKSGAETCRTFLCCHLRSNRVHFVRRKSNSE